MRRHRSSQAGFLGAAVQWAVSSGTVGALRWLVGFFGTKKAPAVPFSQELRSFYASPSSRSSVRRAALILPHRGFCYSSRALFEGQQIQLKTERNPSG